MKLLLVISFLLLACCPLVLCLTCPESHYGPYDKVQEMTRDERVRVTARNDFRSIMERWSRNSKCPELYERYSTDPTFCKVSTCDIINQGVNEEDKKTILEVHNSLRSRLASGKEHRYRELPSAANMMQMEWDDELAQVAQAHASLCVYDHDNGTQRAVENFGIVGQNLIQSSSTAKEWKLAEGWYKKEVCFYFPQYINPFQFRAEYGHFTQVTWAATWKVGCGFAAYREKGEEKSIYTCNYGPGGNVKFGSHYIQGEPCSKCPDNTECSKEYPGLCKSKTENGPQFARPPSENYIIFCDFSVNDPVGCANVKVEGSKQFSTRHIYSGNYKTIILQGGESIIIYLGEGEDAKGICPFIFGRYGPNNAKNPLGSKLEIVFKYKGSELSRRSLTSEYAGFQNLGLHMTTPNMKFEVSFEFKVAEGVNPQYLDAKAWGITKGPCKSLNG